MQDFIITRGFRKYNFFLSPFNNERKVKGVYSQIFLFIKQTLAKRGRGEEEEEVGVLKFLQRLLIAGQVWPQSLFLCLSFCSLLHGRPTVILMFFPNRKEGNVVHGSFVVCSLHRNGCSFLMNHGCQNPLQS